MEEKTGLCVNEGKSEIVRSDNNEYLCYAVKTKIVTNEDLLTDIVNNYAKPYLQNGDILFMSEKMVACTQGRAILLTSIKPGFFAKLLSRFVTKTPIGIGLGMPETMQCAIKECGLIRILFASFVGMIGKLFRKKGWFYKIAGAKAAGIDGESPDRVRAVHIPVNRDDLGGRGVL